MQLLNFCDVFWDVQAPLGSHIQTSSQLRLVVEIVLLRALMDIEVRKRLDSTLAVWSNLNFYWRVGIMIVGRFIVTVNLDRLP